MNIGIDIRELEKDTMTGIGRYLINFLQWVIPAHPESCFFLYGNQKTCFNYPAANVNLRLIPERCTIWWDQLILPYQIKQDRLDVFLSPYIKAPLLTSVPVVIIIHDLLCLVLPEYKKNKLRETGYKCFAELCARRAKAIISVSACSRADIVHLLKITEEKIRLIPPSVSEIFFKAPGNEALDNIKRRFKIRAHYILYVGNFKPHKNISRLLRAYALLETDVKNEHQLLLCGKEDSHTPNISHQIRSLGLVEHVILTGAVAEADLPALYHGSDLFIFPSLYEGFGLPVIESMAAKTAVICSAAASLPEVAKDGALLVDPQNTTAIAAAINRLLTDSSLRKSLIEKGLKQAHKFKPDISGAMLFELLEQTAKG
jgi:glycosyltransferase involved in cell wall biosynthesis